MVEKIIKPGQRTGKDGGIYEEFNTRGNPTGRFATIRDNEIAPPTAKKNYCWKLKVKTPDNK